MSSLLSGPGALPAHGSGEVAEFEPGVLLTEARIEVVPLLLVVALMALYALGVRRLAARGDR